ncbi:iron chelate uptake ABC transporter family permease subunit [Pararhizobium antarcticum]|uniref:Iron ABC transporter permease n=1 Tax=Pararhizobium antarcticum TaxID=1798805 RepID=A0A657LYI3_9HYPH|nr:iron chelate uptake ABC transporter family permease subunit [Pararhizobium antarcticum]OJG00096.1 iron ABC transporter permease [Rhizobium sp. 58]OJG01501.1 iron ABC transporter permease [Pararhizobium antarcticum]
MADRRLLLLLTLALLSVLFFMLAGLRGNIAFVLGLRGLKLLALLQVALSIAVSTVLFQTVTANRILTPSIMGLDALYVFGQTALVFLLGGLGYASLNGGFKFGMEIVLMVALAMALLWPMLKLRMDMGLMLLMGVTLGILFRSLQALLARMLDPNAFAVVQGASFANFNALRTDLTLLGAIMTLVAVAFCWRARHRLDVIALGRDAATGLGVHWTRSAAGLLLLVSILVAVSTALVGPVAFFGLLVVALAERVVKTQRHAVLLPAAVLVAITVLVGGQAVLQHALGGASTLGVVIEFVGGLVFLILLVQGARK